MIKVAIVGPESTGKTELAEALANLYQTESVPEYSREYLNNLSRDYIQADLLKIARGQLNAVKEEEEKGGRLLIADTDMHVMKVWSEYKYGDCDPWILEQLHGQDYDLYILTDYDIPYEEDPLRENPEDRAYFFDLYLELLTAAERPFVVVKGSRAHRLKMTVERIDALL